MRWWYVVAGAVCACAVVTPAGAAPIPGGTRTNSVLASPAYVYFLTAGGALDGGLTAAGCPFVPPAPDATARTSTLTAKLDGWYGPTENPDTDPSQQFLVRGHVAGTVEDGAGNRYHATGDFLDASTHFLFDNDLLFDGRGTLTLAGPGGVVVGDVELSAVNAPLEFAFTFDKVSKCTIGSTG